MCPSKFNSRLGNPILVFPQTRDMLVVPSYMSEVNSQLLYVRDISVRLLTSRIGVLALRPVNEGHPER